MSFPLDNCGCSSDVPESERRGPQAGGRRRLIRVRTGTPRRCGARGRDGIGVHPRSGERFVVDGDLEQDVTPLKPPETATAGLSRMNYSRLVWRRRAREFTVGAHLMGSIDCYAKVSAELWMCHATTVRMRASRSSEQPIGPSYYRDSVTIQVREQLLDGIRSARG